MKRQKAIILQAGGQAANHINIWGQALLTYTKDFDKHHLNVVGGWSLEKTSDGTSYTLAATQFPNNAIEGFDMDHVKLTDASVTLSTEYRLISCFARAEYGYDSRYLLTASIRRDGRRRTRGTSV